MQRAEKVLWKRLRRREVTITFISSDLNLEDKNLMKVYPAFVNFVSYKTGIHFGGNVAQNGLMNFDYMPFKEQTKSEKPGIGMIPEMNTETDAQKIVVPLVKGKKKQS